MFAGIAPFQIGHAQTSQADLVRPTGAADLNSNLARLASNPRDVNALIGAGEAALACLASGRARDLGLARRRFMRENKMVFRMLGAMQDAYYRSDERRERFVSLCGDVDVQRLTFEAYMNKRLVRKRPLAHLKIMAKNIAHLTGIVPAVSP